MEANGLKTNTQSFTTMHRIFLVSFHPGFHGGHAAASAFLGFVLLALMVCAVCALVSGCPHESDKVETKKVGAA